jgi:hypothetical protein
MGRSEHRTRRERGDIKDREAEEMALVFAGLSPTSIGNELRRYENKKYRRDDQNRWHLIEGSAAGAKQSAAPAAPEVYQTAA